MKFAPWTLAAVLLTAAALPLIHARSERPGPGQMAPEISAPTWFNHLGQSPDLAGLRGQAVLIDFWATWCGPCVAAWPHIQELHEKYGPDGLVVLGLSDEDEETVAKFVDENGYTARIAAGSPSGPDWGVEGIPDTILIDPSGEIVFRGHPMELSESLVAKTVKKAKKPDPRAALAVAIADVSAPALAPAVAAAAGGDLAKAFTLAEASLQGPDAEAAAKVKKAVEAHVDLVLSQAQAMAQRKDVRAALDAFRLVEKSVAGTPLAATAAERREAVEKDPATAKELEAAEAFEKLLRKTARLSSSKAVDALREFATEFDGTRASRIARMRAVALGRK